MTHAQDTIDAYLSRLDGALRELHEREREELLAEIRVHLEETAARAGDADAAVASAVRSLGDPAALAVRLREGGEEEPAPDRVKRILGMPYNFSPMSTEQIAARVWNPSDPRILMPRLFGVGWTLNFGAIAVRLGLVQPDDEEPLPFASVPDGALWTGLAVLTALNLFVLAAALLVRDLPRPLPTHWGLVGPDAFAAPMVAAAWQVGPVLVLNAIAAWRFVSGASRTSRTLWLGSLALFVVMLDGLYASGVYWAATGRVFGFAGLPVLAGAVAGFAVFVLYSRLGVRAEWRKARVER